MAKISLDLWMGKDKKGSVLEHTYSDVARPAELHIPTETQVRVISSLIRVGIRWFCTTGCGMISFIS